jgi:uncharacterized membrane protein YdjX (TVP38/TMEM64 family)
MITQFYDFLQMKLQNADIFTAAIYMIVAKTISGITFIPGTPLTILAGAIFGTFWGSIISWIGNLIGAVLAFLMARYFLKDFVQNRILRKYPKINEYEDALFKRGFWTVTILRLTPIFPFNFLNFALAVTEVKFKDYFWGTAIGMIPGTILFVYFGESIRMLSGIKIVSAILLLIVFIYITKKIKTK